VRLEEDIVNLYLKRAAVKQCDILYAWTNEEEVRRNSFNQEKIPYEQHVKWFNNKINSNSSIIFLCYEGEIPVGVVRIEMEAAQGTISYSVDKNYRGKGVASSMLKLLEEEIKNNKIDIHRLIGYVKFDNIPSQNIFKKLGYIEKKEEEAYKYEKDI